MTAIEKINTQMQEDPNDLYTEIIGHYLIDRCMTPEDETLIGADGKTLAGAMSAVESAARKKAAGKRVGVLSDYETGKIIDDYFGLTPNAELWQRTIRNAIGDDGPKEPAGGVALDLADFL